MDREAAIAAFATLERREFTWPDSDAPEEEWADDNTPPTRRSPTFDVRLDAKLDVTKERGWRLFVRTHPWMTAEQTADAAIAAIEAGREAGAEISLANGGIELE